MIKLLNISKKTNFLFISITGFFLLLFLTAELVNHRFWLSDFTVYFYASDALIHNSQIYQIAFGLSSGFFKYSPFSLFVFVPAHLFTFEIAKVIHFLILSTLIIYTIIHISNLIKNYFFPDFSKRNKTISQFLVLLLCGLQFYFELHLGNINIFLLLLSVLVLELILKGNDKLAGVLLALSILFKPHFVLLLPLLVLRRKFKTISYFTIFLFLGLAFPIIFLGFAKNLDLHHQWLNTMMMHTNSSDQGFDTIPTLISQLVSMFTAFSIGSIFKVLILLFVYSSFCLLVLFHLYKESKRKSEAISSKNLIFEFSIVLALIPNLMITDFEHFMFSMPLIFYVLMSLFSKKNHWSIWCFSILGFLLYSGNIREFIGTDASAWMTSHGMLGLGNLVIICVAILMFFIDNLKVRIN